MDAKLIVNGKEFDIVINDPELIQMVTKTEEKNGYERVSIGDFYYYTDVDGTVGQHAEDFDLVDGRQYDVGNYYSDRKIAEDNARADKLMWQLRRFAAEENKRCADWSSDGYRRVIYYDHIAKTLSYYNYTTMQTFGAIAFDSEEGVKKAMETFMEDLIWYFTEYKDRL